MDTSQFSAKSEYKPVFDKASILHAYIVLGPDTEDKRAFINTLAAAMLCESSAKAPCGVCRACKKSVRGIHPDIIEVTKADDLSPIPVAVVRDVRSQAIILPNEADCKVFVIHNAENMNANAQNALLKTLEEPPKHCRFILSAENPASLLETVRSRCATLRITTENTKRAGDMESAEEFYKAIDKGELKLAEFLYKAEKFDKDKMADFLTGVSELGVEKLKNGGDVNRISKILTVMQKAGEYQKFNVNSGHIAGFILSGLAEIL